MNQRLLIRMDKFSSFCIKLLFIIFVLLLTNTKLFSKNLRVYTQPIEPFVSVDRDKPEGGFSIELWQAIAKNLNIKYDIFVVNTVNDLLKNVQSGNADIAIAAITATSEREKLVDFSHIYYTLGLSILTSGESKHSFSSILRLILSKNMLKLLLVIIIGSFIMANLIWLTEHRRNPKEFPGSYGRGLFEAVWYAACTLFAGTCNEKVPYSFLGRLLSIFWLTLSIALISSFTALLTTSLTVENLKSDIRGPGDLPGKIVATVKGTHPEQWLIENGIEPITTSNISDAIDMLIKGKVMAVVYDSPILRYEVKKRGNRNLAFAGPIFDKQGYAIALPLGSHYRKQINQEILQLSEQGITAELDKKYFGD